MRNKPAISPGVQPRPEELARAFANITSAFVRCAQTERSAMATMHEVQFIRQRATDSQLLDILSQRDLALAVVAAAEKQRQLAGTPYEEAAEQTLAAALVAYREHYCRSGERIWPLYDRETGKIA